MNVDLALFPYVNLAAAVLTVVLGVWVVVRAENSKKGALEKRDELQFRTGTGGDAYVYLGGMFGQITEKLDRVVDTLEEGHSKMMELHVRDQAKFDDAQRIYSQILQELRGISQQLNEMDNNNSPRRRR